MLMTEILKNPDAVRVILSLIVILYLLIGDLINLKTDGENP